MLTFPLGARIAVIAAAVATIALVVLANERSVGFGVVREGQSAETPARPPAPDLPRQLTRLRVELGIEPAQEAVWTLFESRMLDLDRVSRRVQAESGRPGTDAAAETAQHALLFAVALSEMDGALSSTQSLTLNRQARVLGSSFICAEARQKGS